MSNENQPRSPAITIVRTNNRPSPPVEPFYRPKHLPHTSHSPKNDFISQSLPNNLRKPNDSNLFTTLPPIKDVHEKKQASDEHPEGPQTPHSRAKNVARFYPVTKEATVVKADVRFLSFIGYKISTFCFRHPVVNVKHVIVKIHRLKVQLVGFLIHVLIQQQNHEAIQQLVRRKINLIRLINFFFFIQIKTTRFL